MSSKSEKGANDSGGARVVGPNRHQPEFRVFDVDALIPQDHRARTLWAAVERMDLAPFYAAIKSREGGAGRPALDPKMLLTLWLYATSEGVGSARHLARLCERDHPYMWICGGVKPNHHDLSDFRVAHSDKLDKLLTELLASFMKAGILKLVSVAQDGTRVRAAAGGSSFRRASTLRERCLVEAKEQVETLRRELETEPSASNERATAARERVARERLEAVERALKELPKVAATHARSRRVRESRAKRSGGKVDEKKSEPRVSTTDNEARVMKMADGGFRPAYNMQFATDTESRLIVGVAVTNAGSDRGEMPPMLKQIADRTGMRPQNYLVDGGYAALAAIDEVEAAGTRVYAPVGPVRKAGVDPYARKEDDTDQTFCWRERMKSGDAKRIYKQRASTAETVHADMRAWRGLGQLRVRGLRNVRAIALLQALTYNLIRTAA
jgi:transposase